VKDVPDQEIIFSAEELNVQYSSLAAQSAQLPSPPSLPSHHLSSSKETFSFRNVSDLEVKVAIYGVKSMAIGLDGISLKFIKLILPHILPCITHIFNTILTKSQFPKTWKFSKVLPIAKSKHPASPSDYRP
jgi:hypothetical protein